MTLPEQGIPQLAWPANELEEVLAASVGHPGAGGRIVEVLGRSRVWVPLPNGGGPESAGPGTRGLDLPTVELDGAAYVPVYSSEQEFLRVVGSHMSFTVAPAREFARGLPPNMGIAVNPDGAVGVPLPPPAVAALCREGRQEPDGLPSGGRVRLFEPDWQDEPVDFLAAAGLEFSGAGIVLTARRALASVEGDTPALFVGVQIAADPAALHDGTAREAVLSALGRALGAVPVPWSVQLVMLDLAHGDPVADWMLERVRPFYSRDHS
ncbi:MULTISPECIES: enhanced serine sensitivity protein SseB [unclassified Streptomyces]|uniref:enhanced serine sensitivity protein SseB n=1 Tax=unclassified Streptomyces TaxID=2593676 RepID=UPI00087FBF1E|nr:MULTISPECIES: enhanced serine sensitivity protein SseB [unclassified Streptomyces]PBC85187.1 type III secretion system (T3SS) SseB-like protein [Streptomyces sp. 2321.6]SDR20496.1 SseB protein N-terminal domain-containing protein [Streptomyces sp. KS_16]SED58932.1 SseB protein N-terminal domain-containing protein [Streptomyces sp. 2133.1]SEE25186.1 SseB protein N-terminal domain-containing protein [Streptomyces sp. 2112.3]SNC71209.1 SseB protein N-terminal domain-containing protein [Strepto